MYTSPALQHRLARILGRGGLPEVNDFLKLSVLFILFLCIYQIYIISLIRIKEDTLMTLYEIFSISRGGAYWICQLSVSEDGALLVAVALTGKSCR